MIGKMEDLLRSDRDHLADRLFSLLSRSAVHKARLPYNYRSRGRLDVGKLNSYTMALLITLLEEKA